MTEEEFLEKRVPFWLEGDNLNVTIPSNIDKKDVHSHLCKKYGYEWIHALRGYWWPESHVMIYTGDYETPNMTVLVIQYLFNYFKDIKYVGVGCNKGKPGELWTPKIIIPRDISLIKDDMFNG